jgi:hypothetical protein
MEARFERSFSFCVACQLRVLSHFLQKSDDPIQNNFVIHKKYQVSTMKMHLYFALIFVIAAILGHPVEVR